jgi:hypothetical protein
LSGALFYIYLEPSTPVGNIYGFSIIMAAGCGLTMQLGYAVALLKVIPTDAVKSISLQNVSQIGAMTICLVIAGHIFQSVAVNNLTSVLAGKGFSKEDIRNAAAGAQSALLEQLDDNLRSAALEAITGAIHTAFTLVIAGVALEVVAAVAMRRERLFGETTAS